MRWACLSVMLVTFSLSGCGSKNSDYQLSGKVTFQGKPVPAGSIRFEPDAAAGNSGSGAHADVKAGEYKTRPEQGLRGGAYKITISGTDGVAFEMDGGVMNPQGKPLFPD